MAAKTRRRKPAVVSEPESTYSPRRILLDTHAWLWWFTGDQRLGREAKALIKRTDDVRFSAASAWEIAIKRTIGTLVFHGETDLSGELERDGFTPLAITVAHADAVRRLPPVHRDSFDRMLVAQAQLEGLTIVTADDVIPRYGVAVFDARQ